MALNNIRFYITEKCNAKCPNCFNRQHRSDTHMDMEHFLLLCEFFSSYSSDQIKIMGGEPTLHPYFSEMMKLAQHYYKRVNVFTNAITDSILEFTPRESDAITYNFRFRKVLTPKKLLLDQPGDRNLEIQITQNVEKEKLVEDIIRVCNYSFNRIKPCLTLDCTSDIFSQKELVVPIYEYVWAACLQLGIKMGQDHLLPMCYLEGSHIPMTPGGSKCLLSCAGLIDSSYNLHYCNQYYKESIPVFNPDGNIVPIKDLELFLKTIHQNNLQNNLDKGCSHCPMFAKYCNGGCFAGNDKVQRLISPF